MMNEQKFWQMIMQVHIGGMTDMDKKCELVKEEIQKLSKEDAEEFQKLFDQQMDKAYTWPLWGAAYVIGGGCSDDAFMDFRSSLISRGEMSLKAALLNPDSLADQMIDEDSMFYEGFQYAVSEGVENVLGKQTDRYAAHPTDPSGEEWTEEQLDVLYPKLSAKAEGLYDAEEMEFIISKKAPWWKFWAK